MNTKHELWSIIEQAKLIIVEEECLDSFFMDDKIMEDSAKEEDEMSLESQQLQETLTTDSGKWTDHLLKKVPVGNLADNGSDTDSSFCQEAWEGRNREMKKWWHFQMNVEAYTKQADEGRKPLGMIFLQPRQADQNMLNLRTCCLSVIGAVIVAMILMMKRICSKS